MKFGKELASQIIPEWQEAYMDYNYLKTLIKDIHRFKLTHTPSVAPTPRGLTRKITFYRAFSGLTQRFNSIKSTAPGGGDGGDLEDQVILVNAVENEGADEGGTGTGRYETMFLMANDEGGELELVFFRRLDEEFNKVVDFYKKEVEGVMEEAALLNTQMDALIAFRIKVDDPEGSIDWSVEMSRLRTTAMKAYSGGSANNSPMATKEGRKHMDVIEENDQSQEEGSDGSVDSVKGASATISTNTNITEENKPRHVQTTRPAPMEILNHVKFNNTLETPRSTLKGILNFSNNHGLNFGKDDLRKVEEKLKTAFIEFYQKLRLLKSYSFLNLLAFSKIMKKYDKIASRNASKAYLNMVDNSYLGSSEEVNKLIGRVEATFIKHFANANRSKGINILRPKTKREKHRTTYFLGFFSGCTAALVVALVLIVHARDIIKAPGSTKYMETLFPLYSLFGFIVLHMLMYAANIYFWRRYRVNYPFIFGFKQGTELGYREVFLVGAGLATLALASVLSNLDMEMDPNTKDYKALTELLPLGLVAFVLLITFCPLNIIYRSSRFFLLQCAFHCLLAPLYKVTLPDFFLADQMTSQLQSIRNLVFYVCYYGWGDFKRRENTCKTHVSYNIINLAVVTIPYWWRLFQCVRRLCEEKDKMHIYNALKYFSTIVAVCARTIYTRRNTVTWLIIAWTSSVIAAVVSTYWDIVIDWGLLQRHSKNRWLRDKLLVPHKPVYFVAIVANVLLRFAWMQTVLGFQVFFLHGEALIAIVASLEIIRRGIWNFFRLENEHLNNVGKYRAFKSVPLPFNYNEEGKHQ